MHRSRTLLLRDVTAVDGIACTSVARTLLDLATIVERRGLERACDRAQVLRSFDLNEIGDVLDRAGGHRGAGRLRAVLAEHDIGTTETRSPLEERFLAILDAAGIRRPTADHTIDVGGEPVTVDFAWGFRARGGRAGLVAVPRQSDRAGPRCAPEPGARPSGMVRVALHACRPARREWRGVRDPLRLDAARRSATVN